MIGRSVLLGCAGAFVIQAGLLGYMLVARATMLTNSTEIRLPVLPVDPRDFFRGDYVILSFPMSRVDAAELRGQDVFEHSAKIFVELAPEENRWKPVALHASKPQDVTSILGTVTGYSRPNGCADTHCAVYDVAYNLEKFFVPEGEGQALEHLRNDQRIEVDVALADSGRAALKRLRVDGQVRYEEPMF